MRSRVALLLALIVLIASRAHAQDADSTTADPHQVMPERPTVATHAHTVAPGWVEIEAGFERDRGSAGERASLVGTVTKFGLPPRLQLDVNLGGSWNGVGENATSGFGDAALALKWRFAERVPVFGDVAVQSGLKFPTGDAAKGTGTGTTDGSLLLISSHVRGDFSLDVNAGWTRRLGDGTDAPRDATLWAASLGFPVQGPVAGVVELFGAPDTSGPGGDRGTVAVLCGPTLTPRPWLELDAGVIVPVRGPQPHGLYAGGVWNVGRLPSASR